MYPHLPADCLSGRSLLAVTDLTRAEFLFLVDMAFRLRQVERRGFHGGRLAGRNLALVFEHACAPVRAAFEVAAHEEGAHVMYLGPADRIPVSGAAVTDTARVLGRMLDGIGFVGAAQRTAEMLRIEPGVPVWNGGTPDWRPVQMLADVLTMRDHAGLSLDHVSVCYLGDGGSASARSLLTAGALLGLDVRVCAPESLWPDERITRLARDLAARSGASVTVTSEAAKGVEGACFLYADRCPPAGARPSERQAITAMLRPYRVSGAMMTATGNPAVKVLSGQAVRSDGAAAITDDVFGSGACLAFEQAENVMHVLRALMIATVSGPP